jgi:hypothetical protein
MKKKLSIIFISFGFLFLLNAIFGRYFVLPGYVASLEQGQATLESASQAVSAWKIIRYLLWAYSFKLGIYFIILGATLRTKMSSTRKWIIASGGFVYISFAYLPLPSPASITFGIAGGLMTLFMIFAFSRWANERDQLEEHQRTTSDYRMAGYFFFAMATYTLCPLMGVKTFALAPEKMIQYGLQQEAASFAFHMLIELVLGWSFTSLSFCKEKILAPLQTRLIADAQRHVPAASMDPVN